jgi:hypothetical protein
LSSGLTAQARIEKLARASSPPQRRARERSYELSPELVEPGGIGEAKGAVEQLEHCNHRLHVEYLPPLLGLKVFGVDSLRLDTVYVEQIRRRVIE